MQARKCERRHMAGRSGARTGTRFACCSEVRRPFGEETMKRRRFQPPLNKRKIAEEGGYRFYAVNALAVRDAALEDEEFTTFAAADELPDLVPEGEVWI